MSGPTEEIHVQVELPSPTNNTSPWNPLHAQHQVAKKHRDRPNWTHRHDDFIVSVATPAHADHEVMLSQKLLSSQFPLPHRLTHLVRGSDISLEGSDLDADARPQSPSGSFTGEYGEYEPNELEPFPGDHPERLIAAHSSGAQEPGESAVPPSLTRPTRIRFRSRVRITSGLNRHRHSINPSGDLLESRDGTLRSTGDTNGGYCYYSPSSSISGSPSSSISAPLRSRTDDETDRPGWGPLGRRVSFLAKKNRVKKLGPGDANDDCTLPTETSPLLTSSKQSSRPRAWRQRRSSNCLDGSQKGALTPEGMDETFGKWPSRMLNYQWWWWQTEGAACCRCLDESDDEQY